MDDLAQRFAAHWSGRGFGRGGRPVLLALSGGLDSMALAHLLIATGVPFAVAHCNFSLRGADSDGDAAFVSGWAADKGISCHTEIFDTAAYAAANSCSIQVAARELRYAWFERLRAAHHYASILTAHHADDVAETILINLCRGTGIAGLHGIPERNGAIIRPLLFATRSEILAFATESGIVWREDASNAKGDYLRNALRHDVLPKMEGLMPGAGRRIAETARRVGEAEAVYRAAVARRLERLLERRGKDWYIPIRLLRKSPGRDSLAYELFSSFGFSPEQLPGLLRLMAGESGRSISSPTHRAIRHRDFIVVTAAAPGAAALFVIEDLPSVMATAEGTFAFSWQGPGGTLGENPNVAYLSGDDIRFPLVLRTRREGDYFYPLGMGGKKKKLKRFLIDIKLPAHEKDRIRILETDKKILWIAGKRIDERFRVTAGTKKILRVVFTPSDPVG